MTWLEMAALPVGVLSAWGYVSVIECFGRRRVALLASGLVVAALVYLVAALVRGDAAALVRESLGVGVFAAFALLGAWRAPVLVAIGWGLHILWDLRAQVRAEPIVPLWYALACLGFDAVVARSLLRDGSETPPPASS